MFDYIRSDIRRYSDTRDARARGLSLHVLLFCFGFHSIFVYRFGRWLKAGMTDPLRWPCLVMFPIYFLMAAYVRAIYDIDLELSADIGPGLLLWHFGGVRVRDCRLGESCTIHQRVTISPIGKAQGPQLADRVWIGPHAHIVGALRVGTGATIGAGAILCNDVAERTVVVGNPARVVAVGHDNSRILGLPPREGAPPTGSPSD